MSADPVIDCAANTQAWNRYSYVRNRSLNFTDPTGYYQMGQGMNWKIVWINGVDLENVTVTGRSPEVDIALSQGMWLGNLRNGLNPPSAGLPLNEDGVPELTVTATRLPGGARRSPQSKQQGRDCAQTCRAINAVAAGAGGALAGGAAVAETGIGSNALGVTIGALLGGLAAGMVAYNSTVTSGSVAATTAAVAATGMASSIPGMAGGAAGAVVGNGAESGIGSIGAPAAVAVPGGSAVGGAFGGAISGFFRPSANWAKAFANAASSARSAGAIGLAAGAVTVAVSEALQAATGCDCGT